MDSSWVLSLPAFGLGLNHRLSRVFSLLTHPTDLAACQPPWLHVLIPLCLPLVLFLWKILTNARFFCISTLKISCAFKALLSVSNKILLSVPALISPLFMDIRFFKKDFERDGNGWRRKGEKHQCERETSISCLLHAPQPGTEPATQACVPTGTKPATFHFTGWRPTDWATPVTLICF